ncbi:MAG: glycosyltransferase family 4 protein [Phycisphaerae bacterium]
MSRVVRTKSGEAGHPTATDHGRLRDAARADIRGAALPSVNGSSDDVSAPVLLLGPPRDTVGGMSSVMQQMASLDMGGRYRFQPFHATAAPPEHEGVVSKIIRHVRHLGALRAAIRDCGAAIAHIHTCSGVSFARSAADLIVARHARCKTVLHIHGAKFDQFFDSLGPGRRTTVAGVMRLPDCVIALSDAWQKKLQAMAPGARIVVMENATAIPHGAGDVRSDGPCRFLLLGRMDVWKGIDDLLDAAAILKNHHVPFQLTLAGPSGTAGDAHTIGGKIAARGLRPVVHYAGPVFGAEKDRLLREADVYVQPSHNEGMPIALLEALAHGLAVVATRVGAVPEVIEHGREGLLVDATCVTPLASAMETLGRDNAVRRTMSKAAQRLARSRFGLRRLQTDLLAIYDGLCATGKPGSLFAPTAPRRGRAR